MPLASRPQWRLEHFAAHLTPTARQPAPSSAATPLAADRVASTVRWGIMGTANITKVVLPAIAAAENAEIIACTSRSEEKATAWAAERGIPRAYGSYQALLDDADVDAVYIPLPTSVRSRNATTKASMNVT
eukprot:SAG11_NODE_2474_length_3317_cov_2.656930_4_plen_131_part_00